MLGVVPKIMHAYRLWQFFLSLFFLSIIFFILKGVLQDFLAKILGWVKEMKSTGLFL